MSFFYDWVKRGLRSAQPAAAASNKGMVYWVTDESKLERSSGSAWEAISATGGGTGDILANGTVPFTADQSMGAHKLTNVTDPTSAQDAATKAYVDAGDAGDVKSKIIVTDEAQASNTAYADLTTVGPTITLLTGTEVAIWLNAKLRRPGGGGGFTGMVGVDISGATTRAPDFTFVISSVGSAEVQASALLFFTGLTAGINTFKAKYRNDGGGTWNFRDRFMQISR